MDNLVSPPLKKTARIMSLLAQHPGEYTASQVAKTINCTQYLVYKVAEGNGLQLRSALGGKKTLKIPKPPTPEALERLRMALQDTCGRVEFVADPIIRPAVLRVVEPKPSAEDKARLELVKLLEEVFARQKRIWGDGVM